MWICIEQKDYLENILVFQYGSVLEYVQFIFVLYNVSWVFCYDFEIEVFMSIGWVLWFDIKGDEMFVMFNLDMGDLEYQWVIEVVYLDYEGFMYWVSLEQVDFLVMLNYCMWV